MTESQRVDSRMTVLARTIQSRWVVGRFDCALDVDCDLGSSAGREVRSRCNMAIASLEPELRTPIRALVCLRAACTQSEKFALSQEHVRAHARLP